MAGGTFLAQNKVRPGAYINFTAFPQGSLQVGDRGIASIAIPMSWGANGELITVNSSDMLDGASLPIIGFDAFTNDESTKLLNIMLQYCAQAKVFRADVNGAKATKVYGNLTVTAKYAGTLGNSINMIIRKNGETLFDVETYVNGVEKDVQTVASISELTSNDWVDFSGTGALAVEAGSPLAGGTNGTVEEESYMSTYLGLLAKARFQVMACQSKTPAILSNVATFIEQQRNAEGRYVQAVVGNYDADFEGIINVANGVKVLDVDFQANEAVAIVAGMTAGANINESNTARVVQDASMILGELTNTEIIDALKQGKFIFSAKANGDVKVEQDINSLHTFTVDKPYAWSKNRVVRGMDEIGTTVSSTWDDSYNGKVNNNPDGRAIFKGDVVAYLTTLQNLSVIQLFAGADDVEVSQGTEVDAVVCNLNIQPVDSMEKLYMTVRLR